MFRLKTNSMKGTLIIITLIHHRQGNIVIIGDQAFEEIEQKSLDISKTQIALNLKTNYTHLLLQLKGHIYLSKIIYMTPKINCNHYCIG